MRAGVAVGVGVLMLVTAGCSSAGVAVAGPGSSASQRNGGSAGTHGANHGAPSLPRPPASQAPRSSARLRSELLTLADMPAGWSASTDTTDDDDAGGTGCKGIDDLSHMNSPGEADADFVQGDGLPDLQEDLYSGGAALMSKEWSEWAGLPQKCPSIDITSGGASAHLTIQAESFPRVGEASSAISETGEVDGTAFVIAVVAWRKDGCIGEVTYTTTGDVDIQTLQGAVTKAAARM